MAVPQEMDLSQVPERFRKIRQQLRSMPERPAELG